MTVNSNHEIAHDSKEKELKFSPSPGFEPWFPRTQSHCASIDLHCWSVYLTFLGRWMLQIFTCFFKESQR